VIARSAPAVYLDSSALVKLVIREPESQALNGYLETRPTRVSAALVRVEVPLAARRHGAAAIARAHRLLGLIGLVRLDDLLLDAAGSIELADLRSPDAIHLAAAQTLGEELSALVTYDSRMADAARTLGMPVDVPR
jgi:predicted nucleic acid-binding protein